MYQIGDIKVFSAPMDLKGDGIYIYITSIFVIHEEEERGGNSLLLFSSLRFDYSS